MVTNFLGWFDSKIFNSGCYAERSYIMWLDDNIRISQGEHYWNQNYNTFFDFNISTVLSILEFFSDLKLKIFYWFYDNMVISLLHTNDFIVLYFVNKF